MSDMKRYVQLNKEYKELGPVVEASERYRIALSNLEEAKELLAVEKDDEMREMAKGEIETCCACTRVISRRKGGAARPRA